MTTFVALHDCVDPTVVVEADDLERAHRLVLAQVKGRGVDPDDVTDADGLALLADLEAAQTILLAALRGVSEGDTVLQSKVDEYRARAEQLLALVSRESLGLARPGSGSAGYGSIPVGRG